METTNFIWLDGKLIPWEEAKIHVLTHSLHYGSAVFEGVRFYETSQGPAVFRLKEHTERLFNSAKAMHMSVPYSPETINQAILATIKANGIKNGYIRPIIFYGYGKMGLGVKDATINVSIAVWPWGAYLGDKPVRVKTSSFERLSSRAFVPSAKVSGHYVNSILAGEEVREAGYDEALLLDNKGYIAEGPGENFFVIKKGEILTPPLGAILPGITRLSVLEIARDLGLKVKEKKMKPKNIYGADEAFFTGTAAEISSLESLDGQSFKNAPGEITKKLRTAFMDIVSGKNKKYSSWLTLVK